MAKTFDPYNRQSWYFGPISRQDATDILLQEKDGGVFLVRDSSSIPGEYVLCVKEDNKVCHYIINKVEDNEGTKYRIGDRYFPDLPLLLSFYKLHYLDTTPLVRPATRKLERVIAKHDFDGSDPEDLPFKKNEVLTILSKDEEQWWTAKNSLGRVGAIPVPYIKPYDGKSSAESSTISIISEPCKPPSETSSHTSDNHTPKKTSLEPNKDTYARVKQARVPNAYDDTALKLQVGDIIRVTKINISGQWEGELVVDGARGGRKGHFPFTHVELIDFEPDSTTGNSNVKIEVE